MEEAMKAAVEPRSVDAGRGINWWTDAWALFVKSPALWLVLGFILIAPAFAQTDDSFLLKRGENEFGFWAGFSPNATTIFGGLHEDETRDRKFFIAALRYGRTLAAN